jgi:tRNA A37 methylthiotransferase MiaB
MMKSVWNRTLLSRSTCVQAKLSLSSSIVRQGTENDSGHESSSNRLEQLRSQMATIPSLDSFLQLSQTKYGLENTVIASRRQPIPYLDDQLTDGQKQRVHIETYGCQMNVNDSQIVAKILTNSKYEMTDRLEDAQILLLMTCSIREGAETKIFHRLKQLRKQKEKGVLQQIGLIGCMASRLKNRLLERERLVDVIVGPDSYRDLPNLLALTRLTGHNAVNVLLSLDETYADVLPTVTMNMEQGQTDDVSGSPTNGTVQLNNWSQFRDAEAKKAFVSIMRGCDNMCSYCVVPYTRGRERSRSIESILTEVRLLSKAGVKEITLLGQNVNSYRDCDQQSITQYGTSQARLADGFATIYKHAKEGGITFDVLLDQVAQVDAEMRIRFVSPHPKDFTDEVIEVIARHANICKNVHLPAQSGDDGVLQLMRRGYTKQSYLALVQRMKNRIPNITFTSDFICGFTGETEEAFEHTLDLIRQVDYSFIFSFPYSVREVSLCSLH